MIPFADVALMTQLPSAATFWTPEPDDIDEDGMGCFFHDVWTIADVTPEEAMQVIATERQCVDLLSELAADDRQFDLFGRALEWRETDGMELPPLARRRLDEFINRKLGTDDIHPLGDLDIGVAGLVYALAAAGMFPAASCRGHVGPPRPWSEFPVVLLAADRYQAGVLESLVAQAGVGFDINNDRPELLVVQARSILHQMHLASLIVGAVTSFASTQRD